MSRARVQHMSFCCTCGQTFWQTHETYTVMCDPLYVMPLLVHPSLSQGQAQRKLSYVLFYIGITVLVYVPLRLGGHAPCKTNLDSTCQMCSCLAQWALKLTRAGTWLRHEGVWWPEDSQQDQEGCLKLADIGVTDMTRYLPTDLAISHVAT